MYLKKYAWGLILVAFVFSGCTVKQGAESFLEGLTGGLYTPSHKQPPKPVYLTYQLRSEPSGASIYRRESANGPVVYKGRTPQTLSWNVNRLNQDGYLMVDVVYKWASGAKVARRIRLVRGSWMVTLHRPDVPGRDIDVRVALEIERNYQLGRQAEAVSEQAAAQRKANEQRQMWDTIRMMDRLGAYDNLKR